MTMLIDGKKINEVSLAGVSLGEVLCFARFDEKEEALAALRQGHLLHLESTKVSNTRFESHGDFDYIRLSVPDFEVPYGPPQPVEIFLLRDRLFLFCDAVPAAAAVLQEAQAENAAVSPEKALYLFFVYLLGDDHQELLRIEEQIVELEDALYDKQAKYAQTLNWMRRELFQLKRYYEGLYELFEELEENRNNMLSREMLHAFHRHTARTSRLCQEIHNLHDYVTQVRDAYQAQAGIEMNKAIRIFTLITTIFLPVSLLVGLYGITFAPLDHDFPHAYPVVIGAAVAMAAGGLILFKRKQWF